MIYKKIRENITPIGDGNYIKSLLLLFKFLNKREYNSDRRRKQLKKYLITLTNEIRENITPIGDGNTLPTFIILFTILILIRENITPIGDGNIYG